MKKPVNAIILSLIIVLASTLLSVRAKLNNECKEITDGFYSGVKYDGFVHKSIYSQLVNFYSAADGLAAIANNNGIDTENLKMYSTFLKNSLAYNDDDNFGYIYSNYDSLNSAVLDVIAQLHSASLSARDSEGLDKYESTLDGARSVIMNSGYNESVRTFLSSQDGLTMFFFKFTGAKAPEYFN